MLSVCDFSCDFVCDFFVISREGTKKKSVNCPSLNVTLNPMLLFTGISLAASLSFSPETEEKLDQLSV